ncbi:hypothetical protein NVP1188A_66 [Vibrio phage 1.188.A._10N.286.51.A6]|uniref:Uncharacterized protein n=5 Tax=Mukerjeevirus TaxID=2733146 RepID=A0A2I7RS48_9CAUD|nr:hypothetical protein HOU77_gp40 [Vibrio phage 1.188.A._10N.286.51.A6]YP_009817666.1 hypothetical protein HOU79_gp40 [Vibrio phage 1.224.A._10N.261.48.B1]YP_009817748.1 hypothetical protein HOU80_gp39 [Vibrio phage 1.261.O._10N.286.51.A7]AUR93720.1 hypothetical protein NVP1188B_66 [Vibrio phage 1.188.B._10N.286.51.A6]AUR93806.1 hypothetical protein NVP1188C_66 [Vibrio phage 1.188.C._10N.286.51.A6]AUR93634.1 hypothetical protein NVP1188A_66 [Vibrio phage 1.188.A._10N.286.51.A6]AUR96433.1 hyp
MPYREQELISRQMDLELTYAEKAKYLDELIQEDDLLLEFFDLVYDEIKRCHVRDYVTVRIDDTRDDDCAFTRIASKVIHTLMQQPKASIQQYVGMLMHDFEAEEPIDAVSMADTFMTRLADTELLDFQTKFDGINVIANFHLAKETLKEMAQYDKPIPSIAPLNFIKKNYSQAYHIITTGSIILGKSGLKHHEYPVDYMAINVANSIPLSICEEFAMQIPYVKDHSTIHPKARAMAKLTFDIYVKQQEKVHEILIEEGNKFYLPHKRDARLRSNVQGKFVNYQKDAFHKASVDFHQKGDVSGFD